jgi:hypothetical protein
MKTLLLAMFVTTAAPSQQFDLVCRGQWRFALLDPSQPHNFRLRVDLATKQWCEDAPPEYADRSCTVLKPIANVQPGLIVFQEESPEDKALGVTRSQIVNRQTGKYLHYEREPRRSSIIAVEADCEPAPFSGFPKVKTKF